MKHAPLVIGAGLFGAALLLRRGGALGTLGESLKAEVIETIQSRLQTSAGAWAGRTEDSPEVLDLVNQYMEAWQWPAEDRPGPDGPVIDWCGIWVAQVLKEAYLPGVPWPIYLYTAPLPLHPFERWLGGVGQILALAEGKGWEVSSPQPGDMYSIGTTHVGIVRAVSGETFATWDANWSNQVGSRTTSTDGKRFFRFIG